MDIAIVGASGDVGRQIAARMVARAVLSRHERLQLVGRRDSASASTLEGFAGDLLDAYAEKAPLIDIALDPEELAADLIVFCAGETIPTDPSAVYSRSDLARRNAAVFHTYARALAECGSGHELVLVVSNPVELGVAVFARWLGRQRAFGMGAYLDTMRFREEVAACLRLSRGHVAGFMGGEHGDRLVPFWSTVRVFGFTPEERAEALDRIRRGHRTERFAEELAAEKERALAIAREGRMRDAFAYANGLPPDFRVAIKPFLIHVSGSKTVLGTAEAVAELIECVAGGAEVVVCGQTVLEGEYGVEGSVGVPFVLSNAGVERVVEFDLLPEERAALRTAAEAVRSRCAPFLEA